MSISLSNHRCEEIKKTVVKLFVNYEVSCVPVSGFELATRMGVKIIPYSALPANKRYLMLRESKDGFCIEKNAGEWYIIYNDDMTYGRINNTIMHEIGHIVLDHYEDSELAEKEVNFFAKYALAPPVLIHKLQLTNSREIARVFQISHEAAEYAYVYYIKWLKCGPPYYTDYELVLLELFNEAS